MIKNMMNLRRKTCKAMKRESKKAAPFNKAERDQAPKTIPLSYPYCLPKIQAKYWQCFPHTLVSFNQQAKQLSVKWKNTSLLQIIWLNCQQYVNMSVKRMYQPQHTHRVTHTHTNKKINQGLPQLNFKEPHATAGCHPNIRH